jgi:hypothetical protein
MQVRKCEGEYMRTVGLLRDLALFGEREEDLLRGWLGDCALEVGGNVDGAVWTVYLTYRGYAKNELASVNSAHPLDIFENLILRFARDGNVRGGRGTRLSIGMTRTVLSFEDFNVRFCLGCH